MFQVQRPTKTCFPKNMNTLCQLQTQVTDDDGDGGDNGDDDDGDDGDGDGNDYFF